MSGMKTNNSSNLISLYLALVFTLAACGEKSSEFSCNYPEAFADTGNGCECRTDNGYRTMGDEGQLCVPYHDIMKANEEEIGGVGFYFVHLDRSIRALGTDTLFFGGILKPDSDETGSFTYNTNPVFGRLGFINPITSDWQDECEAVLGDANNISSSPNSGFFADTPNDPEITTESKFEVSWNQLDTDEDCEPEWIRARFTMQSAGIGSGNLYVFDYTEDSPNSRVLTDSIGIGLERIPTSW